MIQKILFRIGLIKGSFIILFKVIQLLILQYYLRIIEAIVVFIVKHIGVGLVGSFGLVLTNKINYLLIFLIMFFSFLVTMFLFVKIYDFFKIDFFLIETKKEHKEKITKKYSKIIEFALTSFLFIFDPLFFVLYLREGHHKYDGLKTIKVWILFTLSVFLATIFLQFGVFIIEAVFF